MTERRADDLSTLANELVSFIRGLSDAERERFADALAGASDRSAEVDGFGLTPAGGPGILANAPSITNPQPGTPNARRKSGLDDVQKILDILHGMAGPIF